jgi:release factor glutamine methyltransferase
LTKTLASLLAESRIILTEGGLPDASTDARVLVAGLLELTPTDFVLRADRAVTDEERRVVTEAIARRLSREPVHRILGRRDFHGVQLLLSPDTLEPRPDTEILVEAVLPFAHQCARDGGSVRLLDLGTGTGAIALALLHDVPQMLAVGTDIAVGALETALRNANLNGVAGRFSALQSRWFDAVDGCFDIIVSNPPYIRSDVIPDLAPDVRDHDPMLALDGGIDGLDAYRAIAAGAHAHLGEQGMLALEIGYDQKHAVSAVFAAQGYTLEKVVSDYGGNDRVMMFSRKKRDGV